MTETPMVALTIAGSDSGGGAGLQADLRTFASHGVHGTSVITMVTAQDTVGIQEVHVIPAPTVRAQLETVLDGFDVAAAKTGFLYDAANVDVVSSCADRIRNLVVDPVLVSGTGVQIVSDATVHAYATLMTNARVLTPNLAEASLLSGLSIDDEADMIAAARSLADTGAELVVVKGGRPLDGRGDEAIDIVWHADQITRLVTRRIDTRNDHGTGCTLAAAIAANLALGETDLLQAVRSAKDYVTRAIASAAEWNLGPGHGPIDQCN